MTFFASPLMTANAHPTTDHPVAWTPWLLPVDLSLTDDGKHIRWSRWTDPDPDALLKRTVVPAWHYGAGLLTEFSRLADGTGVNVLSFARRWGPLGLCAHGLPSSHYRDHVHPLTEAGYDPTVNRPGCEPMSDGAGGWAERVEDWQRLAREVLNVAKHLHDINNGETEDGITATTAVVHGIVNRWVDDGRVRPSLAFTPSGRLIPTIGGDGLFGALALQLLLGVSNWRGLAVCSHCSTVFAPHTKPRPGERQWCSWASCQAGKQAAAAADYRRRQAMAKKGAG